MMHHDGMEREWDWGQPQCLVHEGTRAVPTHHVVGIAAAAPSGPVGRLQPARRWV